MMKVGSTVAEVADGVVVYRHRASQWACQARRGLEGDVGKLVASGEVKRRTVVTRGFDALARPVRVGACSGASWTSLGVLVLARMVLYFVEQGV
jgi:hypothetical protein